MDSLRTTKVIIHMLESGCSPEDISKRETMVPLSTLEEWLGIIQRNRLPLELPR